MNEEQNIQSSGSTCASHVPSAAPADGPQGATACGPDLPASPATPATDGESTPAAAIVSELTAAASPTVAAFFDLESDSDLCPPTSDLCPLDEVTPGTCDCAPTGAPDEIEPEANSGYGQAGLRLVPGQPIIEHHPASSFPGSARASRASGSARASRAPAGAPPAGPAGATACGSRESDLREAQSRANLCQQFDELTAGGLSLIQAARSLGKSPSWFSGANSMYARWKRDGLAGLLPQRSGGLASAAISSLTKELESLPWFIPAAQYFYLLSNRTHATGSVPEAIKRVISLPNVPTGWTHQQCGRFLKVLGLPELPTFPKELREIILARERSKQTLVPDRIARRVRVNPSVVQHFRNPRDWSLNFQSAPGSQRRYFNAGRGQREIMNPGDWFGGDDATPGIAVCVPCTEVRTPCSLKYSVLLGRFQFLAYDDAGYDKILAWDYVIRPRGSYRAEDILNGMGAVTRTHGIPRQGFQFEGGTFNSLLVRHAIELLGCQHWRTYSPHQKSIEAVFHKVWTRLAVQFPHADMGRFRDENKANCDLYEACKAGHKDPRRYFPTLDIVVKVFEEEVAAHNAKLIVSDQYGQWVPDDIFAASVAENPLRPCARDMDWIFAPFAAERLVRGMQITVRVPMFEDFSVPFDFGADWMPHYNRKKIRIHFNPRQPKCIAKVVLLENAVSPGGQAQSAGTILGDAQLIGETGSYIRYIMEWADDNQRAGYLQRQRVANFVRRETRGIGAGGRVEYSKSEERDGLSTVTTISKESGESAESGSLGSARASCAAVDAPSTAPSAPSRVSPAPDRAARRAELETLRQQTDHLFV